MKKGTGSIIVGGTKKSFFYADPSLEGKACSGLCKLLKKELEPVEAGIILLFFSSFFFFRKVG